MPEIPRTDSVLWFRHVPAGPLLARLEGLPPGETIALTIDGVSGAFERMAVGKDGRSTRGLKPVGPMKARWNAIPKGTEVEVELPLDGEPPARAPVPEVPTKAKRKAGPRFDNPVVWSTARPDADLARRPVVIIGCDVGVSDRDRSTGIVVLQHEPGRPLTLLADPRNAHHPEALELLPRLARDHRADVVVLDAPLLPIPRETPPAGHLRRDGTLAFCRPHENMIRRPHDTVIDKAIERGEAEAEHRQIITKFLERVAPYSTWREQESARAPFARAGQALCDALADSLSFVTDLSTPQRGVLEGFPKAFYVPLVALRESVAIATFADMNLVPKNQIDEAVLEFLLDPAHPERFWHLVALDCTPTDGEQAARWEAARDDPDRIAALSMALNGVLYLRGRASAVASTLRDGTFDFGHILSVEHGLYQPWAMDWLRDRAEQSSKAFSSATIEIIDKL